MREQEQKDIDAMISAELDSTLSEIEDYFDEQERLRAEDLKDAEEKAKQKIEVMQSVASATSSILGAIADMYESDTDGAEKNAKKIKALRIASATLDTISGALSAFMSVWKSELPLTAKMITAPITSASEEDRLNQMASDQRVVLVMSDLEVKQNQSKVQVAEASF